MSARTGIRLAVEADRVSEGLYQGVIRRVQRGPAPWGLRKLAPWERELNRTPRADWHAYYLIELWQAVGASVPRTHGGVYPARVATLNQELQAWITTHGRRPCVVHICRYTCSKDSSVPLPLRSRASKLLRLLVLTQGAGVLAPEASIPFEQPLGWGVTVTVGTRTRDMDGDPLPDTPVLRPSIAYKVLTAFPVPPEQLASSEQWAAGSKQQRSAPLVGRNAENSNPRGELVAAPRED